jgi:N-acetylglucosaminyldiphosphoundecaprenol N-acetyl-beta-D-mannosaminyltransferase
MSEKSVKIFGVRIDRVDMDEAFNRFLALLNRERTAVIYTPNTEMVMMAENDREFKEIMNSADLVIPDGIGLIYASKIHHLGLTERVPGIELMDRILKYCHSTRRSIFLFGGKPGTPELAGQKILEKYPNIIIKGVENGYFGPDDENRIIDNINEAKPDVLFVALGAPKQEKWIAKHRRTLNAHVCMGIGGSLDVYAGNVKRAPVIFQKLGIEWMHRLLKEPSRIRRMMALPKFMIKVLTTRNISG